MWSDGGSWCGQDGAAAAAAAAAAVVVDRVAVCKDPEARSVQFVAAAVEIEEVVGSVALAVVVRQAMGCIAARRARSLQAVHPRQPLE